MLKCNTWYDQPYLEWSDWMETKKDGKKVVNTCHEWSNWSTDDKRWGLSLHSIRTLNIREKRVDCSLERLQDNLKLTSLEYFSLLADLESIERITGVMLEGRHKNSRV